MKPADDESDFSEDLFAHTRMSFWDHIEELRTHMWKAIYGFAFCMVISLFFGSYAMRFIAAPVEAALVNLYEERRARILKDLATDPDNPLDQPGVFLQRGFVRAQLEGLLKGAPTKEINAVPSPDMAEVKPEVVTLWVREQNPLQTAAHMGKVIQEVTRRPTLATMNVMEGFIVWLKVSMYLGVIIGSPWIFYQLWSFIAAGLYPTEKQLVHRYMPFSVFLFLSGAAVCQFLVIPNAVRYLLRFTEWMGLEPDLRLTEWLHFAVMFPLVFGLSFQTPLLMFGVYRLGIVEVDVYTKNRRMAFFLLAAVSLLLVPAPDAFSMFAMMVPLWCLYEVGILMCKWSPRPAYEDDESEDDQALVGV